MAFGFGFARAALLVLLVVGLFIAGAGVVGFVLGLGKAGAASGMASLQAILSGIAAIAGAMVGFAVTDTAENTRDTVFLLREMRREAERDRAARK